jgi:hypothetical protein
MSNESLVASRLNLSDEEIATELNTRSIQKTDSKPYTWNGISLLLGPEIVGGIFQVIRAVPAIGWVENSLTAGVDFSLPGTQAILDQLAQIEACAPYIDALKEIGVFTVSPWKDAGNSSDVTQEQVAAIRASILASQQRAEVSAWVANLINEVIQPAVGDGKTKSEIKALIAELE